MELLKRILIDFLTITNEMSVYLLLGFFFAGILKVFFTKNLIYKFSKPTFKSVVFASVLGIPLPLCSCGVLPTGISMYRNGASKGATVSFLTSTPQTGIDSIIISSSILGFPFAIIRVIVAFFAGIVSGTIVNFTAKSSRNERKLSTNRNNSERTTKKYSKLVYLFRYAFVEFFEDIAKWLLIGLLIAALFSAIIPEKYSKLVYLFRYAFVEFFEDIAKWLLIGLLIAALFSAIIPEDFFTMYSNYKVVNLLVIIFASIPMYVCATGSIPIAALLMMKGLSPGLAFIFLMGGPATNAATITLIGKVLGKSTLFIYIISIIIIAILFGLIIDYFLPQTWFAITSFHQLHEHSLIPHFVKIISSLILFLLMINAFYTKYKSNRISKNFKTGSNTFELDIEGMICKNCKKSVENSVGLLPNILSVNANIQTKKLQIVSTNFNFSEIKNVIDSLGFKISN